MRFDVLAISVSCETRDVTSLAPYRNTTQAEYARSPFTLGDEILWVGRRDFVRHCGTYKYSSRVAGDIQHSTYTLNTQQHSIDYNGSLQLDSFGRCCYRLQHHRLPRTLCRSRFWRDHRLRARPQLRQSGEPEPRGKRLEHEIVRSQF